MTLQFLVHFSALIFVYDRARGLQDVLDASNTTNIPSQSTETDEHGSALHTEFKASLINSTVYVISMSVQIATFAVNYKGQPFMQSLRNNRPLCYSFVISLTVILVCVNRWSPSLTEQLSIVEFPDEFKSVLLGSIALDLVAALAIDRVCERLFGTKFSSQE